MAILPLGHNRDLRAKRDRSMYSSMIETPGVDAFQLPANANLRLRSVAGCIAGTIAATFNGRTIATPVLAAGGYMDVGYVERGVVFIPRPGFEVLLDMGMGNYNVIRTAADPWEANLLPNGDFALAGPPPNLTTDWSIASGLATKVAGASNRDLTWTPVQMLQPIVVGATYEVTGVISGRTAGSLTPRFNSTLGVASASISVNGAFSRTMTTIEAITSFAMRGQPTYDGSVDDLVLRRIN